MIRCCITKPSISGIGSLTETSHKVYFYKLIGYRMKFMESHNGNVVEYRLFTLIHAMHVAVGNNNISYLVT